MYIKVRVSKVKFVVERRQVQHDYKQLKDVGLMLEGTNLWQSI